jgi:hypothetical protein
MDTIEERIARLEEAILMLAILRDPAQLEYPILSNDRRAREMNRAEKRLAEIAAQIPGN